MDLNLKGKFALVGGASQGIGYAIAHLLASEGASVLISGRDGATAEAVAAEIERDFGSKAIGLAGDMGVKEDVLSMVQAAVDSFGGLDILVNNAGINVSVNAVEELTAADMEQVLGVNVVGAFLCAREAMRRMKQREGTDEGGRGRIVNIGSLSVQLRWLTLCLGPVRR